MSLGVAVKVLSSESTERYESIPGETRLFSSRVDVPDNIPRRRAYIVVRGDAVLPDEGEEAPPTYACRASHMTGVLAPGGFFLYSPDQRFEEMTGSKRPIPIYEDLRVVSRGQT